MGNYILDDLLCIKPFRKRYATAEGKDAGYWAEASRNYSSAMALVDSVPWRWYVIEYEDGRKELAFVRVLSGGLFSGMRPALYRGLLIPHRIRLGTFAHVKEFRLAF